MMKISDLRRRATVVCPVCLDEFETEIYRVIVADNWEKFDPESVNIAVCPTCGHRFRVGERLLIYLREEDIILFVYPDPEEDVRLVRTTFREVKSVIHDLNIEIPEMVLVMGWGRVVIMWELLRNENLLKTFFENGYSLNDPNFFRKLEQLSELYQEYISSPEEINESKVVEIVKKRFLNIVDL